MPPTRRPLPQQRWHFQHGPIDLVIGADGAAVALAAAHEAAWTRFATVLDELVAELPLLKQPVAGPCPLQGVIARRMWEACAPHAAVFITPMAAVAGAVAEEIACAYRRDGIARAWVNNGGDIALHLAPGATLRAGLVADLAAPSLDGRFVLDHAGPVRGIATSGWRGRSFSLGIADSVTVLAGSAAQADAAATIVANAVDIDDPRIQRRPARALKDDSDLGDRAVTVGVPPLPPALAAVALQRGTRCARGLQARGLIDAAVLTLQGQAVTLQPQHAAGSLLASSSWSACNMKAA